MIKEALADAFTWLAWMLALPVAYAVWRLSIGAGEDIADRLCRRRRRKGAGR